MAEQPVEPFGIVTATHGCGVWAFRVVAEDGDYWIAESVRQSQMVERFTAHAFGPRFKLPKSVEHLRFKTDEQASDAVVEFDHENAAEIAWLVDQTYALADSDAGLRQNAIAFIRREPA